jgi:hypothetical protein
VFLVQVGNLSLEKAPAPGSQPPPPTARTRFTRLVAGAWVEGGQARLQDKTNPRIKFGAVFLYTLELQLSQQVLDQFSIFKHLL